MRHSAARAPAVIASEEAIGLLIEGVDQFRPQLATYQARDLPALVTLARNTWTVVPAGERRCRVVLQAQFQARGALGVLAGWAAAVQAWRNARLLEADLEHYIRHGTPSPRKQRQLRRAAKRRPAGPGHDRKTPASRPVTRLQNAGQPARDTTAQPAGRVVITFWSAVSGTIAGLPSSVGQ